MSPHDHKAVAWLLCLAAAVVGLVALVALSGCGVNRYSSSRDVTKPANLAHHLGTTPEPPSVGYGDQPAYVTPSIGSTVSPTDFVITGTNGSTVVLRCTDAGCWPSD